MQRSSALLSLSCVSSAAEGSSPFVLASAKRSTAVSCAARAIPKASAHISLCCGTLHAGTKPDYILCVHVQAYWAHLDHVVFKKEVFEHIAGQRGCG